MLRLYGRMANGNNSDMEMCWTSGLQSQETTIRTWLVFGNIFFAEKKNADDALLSLGNIVFCGVSSLTLARNNNCQMQRHS